MKAFLRLLSSSLSRLLFGLVSLLPCLSCAGEFTVHPVSVNTNLNSTVNFTCEATGVSFIHFLANGTSTHSPLFENRGFHHTPQTTFNGTTRASLSVWAQAINNNTIISCQLVPGDIDSANATLMIQGQLASVGNLEYIFINGSSVWLSWTAPYTLDNVPITGYVIDDDSDRDRSLNTTASSFLLSPPDPANPDVCNVTIVSVYALNEAGRGQPNNISFYYQRVPPTTPTTSVIPTVNDSGQLSLNISFDTSELCRGEYPYNISIDILNTDATSICHTFNSSVIATGIYPTGCTLPDTVDRFSVNITWSNEGGQFDSVLFSFGPVTNINSSNDSCHINVVFEDSCTLEYNIPVILKCTGEAPQNVTVTIQCNETGVVYNDTVPVVYGLINITGETSIPPNQQCDVSVVSINDAGSSKLFTQILNDTCSLIPSTSVSLNPSNTPTETPTGPTSSGLSVVEIIGIVVSVIVGVHVIAIAITIVVIVAQKCNLRHGEGNDDTQLQGVSNDSGSKNIAVPENAQNADQASSLVVVTDLISGVSVASSPAKEEYEYGNDRSLPESCDGSKGSAFCGTSQTGKGDWMV